MVAYASLERTHEGLGFWSTLWIPVAACVTKRKHGRHPNGIPHGGKHPCYSRVGAHRRILAYAWNLTGTAIGALAGLAELIHATMLPLDFYEAYFRVPWNSVLLMALVGFNYAIIDQSVDERYPYGSKKRAPFLVGACFIVSFLFSVCFFGKLVRYQHDSCGRGARRDY